MLDLCLCSNQLSSENKPYRLNSTYIVYALKNLQLRFQEKNLNLDRDSNLGSPDHQPGVKTIFHEIPCTVEYGILRIENP